MDSAQLAEQLPMWANTILVWIGCGTLTYFYGGVHVTPISLWGLVVATAGAFILLVFYRLFAGHWFVEGEYPRRSFFRRPYRRARRYARAGEFVEP